MNVDEWIVLMMSDFTLSYAAIRHAGEARAHSDGTVICFNFPVEGMEIEGRLDTRADDRLAVTSLLYYGLYSGAWWDSFVQMLRTSTGTLRARCLWESGDVELITVIEGVVAIGPNS